MAGMSQMSPSRFTAMCMAAGAAKTGLRIPRTDVRIVTGIGTRMKYIPMSLVSVSEYKVRCGITWYTLRMSTACVALCLTCAERESERGQTLCTNAIMRVFICVCVGTFSVLGIAQTSRMAPEWFGERPNVSCWHRFETQTQFLSLHRLLWKIMMIKWCLNKLNNHTTRYTHCRLRGISTRLGFPAIKAVQWDFLKCRYILKKSWIICICLEEILRRMMKLKVFSRDLIPQWSMMIQ